MPQGVIEAFRFITKTAWSMVVSLFGLIPSEWNALKYIFGTVITVIMAVVFIFKVVFVKRK